MSTNKSMRTLLATSASCLILGMIMGWMAQSVMNKTPAGTGSNSQAMDKQVLAAIAQLKAPATITVDEELGLVTVKGAKEDVDQTNKMIAMTREVFAKTNATP